MPVFNQDPKINANANIITANSKEELPDPSTVKPNTVALIPSVAQSVYVYDTLDAAAAANLPEGSLVAVPSNTVGLEVIELTTTVANEVVLTSEESALLTEAWNKRKPVIIKCPLDLGTTKLPEYACVATWGVVYGDVDYAAFGFSFGSLMVQFINILDGNAASGTWMIGMETV